MFDFEQFRKLFNEADFEGLGDMYAPDAFMDCNVPSWRFQRQGRAAVVGQYHDWDAEDAAQIESYVEHETPWGAVVEQFQRANDGQRVARSSHIFKVDGDGLIAEHVLYCTGPWDMDTVRRQAADAPMLRP